MKYYDFLIIGSGGAALNFAINLPTDASIFIATKAKIQDNNTNYAQGGITFSLNKADIDFLAFDTIKGGDFLSDHWAVDYLCNNNQDILNDLIKLGVNFDIASNLISINYDIQQFSALIYDKLSNFNNINYLIKSNYSAFKNQLITTYRYQGIIYNDNYTNKQNLAFTKIAYQESNIISKREYGGHTKNYGQEKTKRVCYIKDRTGNAIYSKLLKKCKSLPNVTIEEDLAAIKLLVKNTKGEKICFGAKFCNIITNQISYIYAKKIILATGGYAGNFLISTNKETSSGDGAILAHNVGAALKDMELVQFHPTAMLDGTLVSESVRAHGARLLNQKHEPFMHKYAPKFLELATRDIVTNAIMREIKNQAEIRSNASSNDNFNQANSNYNSSSNQTNANFSENSNQANTNFSENSNQANANFSDNFTQINISSNNNFNNYSNPNYIFLDARYIKDLELKVPDFIKNCKNNLGLNPKIDLIPVAPAAHYCMGGIMVSRKLEVLYLDKKYNTKLIKSNKYIKKNNLPRKKINKKYKTISNLYAVGEAACLSVHGANRLGCNSLLEILVFSKYLAKYLFAIDSNLKTNTKIKTNNFEYIVKHYLYSKKLNYQKLDKKYFDNNNANDSNYTNNSFNCNIKSDSSDKIFNNNNNINNQNYLNKLKAKIKNIIQNIKFILFKYASNPKTIKTLQTGLESLIYLKKSIKKQDIFEILLKNNQYILCFNLQNQLLIASAILKSSIKRKENRGSYEMQDCSKKINAYHTIYLNNDIVKKQFTHKIRKYKKFYNLNK